LSPSNLTPSVLSKILSSGITAYPTLASGYPIIHHSKCLIKEFAPIKSGDILIRVRIIDEVLKVIFVNVSSTGGVY